MKKIALLRLFAIVGFLLPSVFACYHIPKMSEEMSFLISGEATINGYWGRAVGLTNQVGFVGDSMIDGKVFVDPAGNKINPTEMVREGGVVSLLKFNNETDTKIDEKTLQWEIMRYPDDFSEEGLQGEPVSFSGPYTEEGDQFGAAIHFEPDSEKDANLSEDSGYLFVSSLMADINYSNRVMVNTGAVDIFRVDAELLDANGEKGVTPQSVYDGTNPKFISRVSLEGYNLEDFLPDPEGGDDSYEIRADRINPGIGFGYKIAYCAKSEVLVIGAPYESYYKDLQNNNNYILLDKVGAVYVFEPDTPNNLDTFKLKSRLMPEANIPQYKVIEVFNDKKNFGGSVAQMVNSIGEVVTDPAQQAFKKMPNDRPSYYFGSRMDVNVNNSGDVVIAVGVSDAIFQYFHPKEKGAVYSKYYDSKGADITEMVNQNNANYYRFEENNGGYGTIYLYSKESGQTEFNFRQRAERAHYKAEMYQHISPGAYILDENILQGDAPSADWARRGFYGWYFHELEGLGQSVVLHGDVLIAGIPYADTNYVGFRPDIAVTRVWNDVGGMVAFDITKETLAKPFQKNAANNSFNSYDGDKSVFMGATMYDDWPGFARYLTKKGNYLAIATPGYNWEILQGNVGRVQFVDLGDPKLAKIESTTFNDRDDGFFEGSSFEYVEGSDSTTKELYKGYQALGQFMDFTTSGQLLCGVPDFDLGIYYNNPYVQYYSMDNCGAVYTFKWTD